jgi:hypothetical protein
MRRRMAHATELRQWTAARAARFGYLAGCGCSAEAILADDDVGAKSLQAARSVATRWGLSLGAGGMRTVIPMSPRDHDLLERAATARGVSVASLVATLVHVVRSERLVDAVLDDKD